MPIGRLVQGACCDDWQDKFKCKECEQKEYVTYQQVRICLGHVEIARMQAFAQEQEYSRNNWRYVENNVKCCKRRRYGNIFERAQSNYLKIRESGKYTIVEYCQE